MGASDELTDEEVRRFIERGYLWLRRCFRPEKAAEIVASVFGPDGSIERSGKCLAAGERPFVYAGQPLSDCRQWGISRLDVDTGYQIEVESLSPRLARAVARLTAPAQATCPRLGAKWILNLDHRPLASPEELAEERLQAPWHIDTPGPHTTLVGRHDALTLLILWTDVEENGGGTLYSPGSLDLFVQALATASDGLDTTGYEIAQGLIARCGDVRAQTGRAGDVLVTHPFVLHASDRNYRNAVRILENPTVTVTRPLDYRRDNQAPSPVEECVIRRLRALPEVRGALRAHEERAALERRARERLIEAHPTHFFPYVPGAEETEDAAGVRAADQLLFAGWLEREAHASTARATGPLETAVAAAARVGSLFATDRHLAQLDARCSLEVPASIAERAWAMVVLGFTNDEGASYVVGRLLRAMGLDAYPFRTAPVDGRPAGHALTLVVHEGRGALVDAWSDVPVMWVEGLDVARLCREWDGPPPSITGPLDGARPYLTLSAPGGDALRRGLFPRDAFLGGRLLPQALLDAPAPEQLRDAVVALCERPAKDGASTAVWRAFIRLRVREIDGVAPRPAAEYAALLGDPELTGATRRLVRVLGHLASTSEGRAVVDEGAPAEPLVHAPPAPTFDVDVRVRRGDVSAWPRFDPRPIDHEAMRDAWRNSIERRGEPGAPPTLRAYTHFAFCASSCNFCMYWHQVPKDHDAYTRYVSYLVSLVDWYRSTFGRIPIDAAYFGGGTPTATPHRELARYLEAFGAAFEVRGELTMEGHPTTTDRDTVRLLADHGVNRLSMGLQSLEHDVLVRITRRNTPLDALREVVDAARDRSVVVNLDLVLGLPEQSLSSFQRDLEQVAELGPDYVTMYLYEPVHRLPEAPDPSMSYENALTDDVIARLDALGYALADPLGPLQRSARLRRKDGADTPFDDAHTYAQFDETPSSTIALGPGAFGHVFGRYWYREATSMALLEEGRPRYVGTAVTAVDECRSILLDAIDRGRPIAPEKIAAVTGVDVRHAFAGAFAFASERGIFVEEGSVIRVVDREGREELIDRLVPTPPRRPLRVVDDGFEPALVALRRADTDDEVDRAALRELCEILRIPSRGLQVCRNVWVGRRDGKSLYFHVGGPKVEPLRISVEAARGQRRAFISTDRYAIAYATASGAAPNRLEQRFLAWLRARVTAGGSSERRAGSDA